MIVPILGYALLRRWLSGFDAAAIAATYGSVSAVTFITAVQVLEHQGYTAGGHMAAAMALMESPAIIMAVVMANILRKRASTSVALSGEEKLPSVSLSKVLHESLTDGAQLLLLGAMLVGFITGAEGEQAMKPFSGDLFKGMLAFFLLDMGLHTARQLHTLRGLPVALLAYGLLAPLVHAALALAMAYGVGMSVGEGALLMVLAASASYIAVPAVLRHALIS